MDRCEQCKRTVAALNVFGLILKDGKVLKVCPDCYRIVHDKEVKELEVNNKAFVASGLLEMGFNKSDLKQYLKLWAKKQTQS